MDKSVSKCRIVPFLETKVIEFKLKKYVIENINNNIHKTVI